jgi:hypothetical protein
MEYQFGCFKARSNDVSWGENRGLFWKPLKGLCAE